MANSVVDIAIIGGGPTGLFAAFYAGLRDASCKIIDSMPTLGGRLSAVYPEKYIYDVAGFPKILASELVNNLIQQIQPYKTEFELSQTMQSLKKTEDGIFEIGTDDKIHLAKSVIIAAGVGQYSPKLHTAPGAAEFNNKGLSYAVIDKQKYARQRVAIVGGGDSALDWANEFTNLNCMVTLIHRTDQFRAHADSVNKIKATNATILLNSEIKEFIGNQNLEKIVVINNETQVETNIEVDSCVVLFGFNSSLGKIKEFGLELQGNGIIVNSKMETNITGVYAAGDITKYSGKLDLIVTGFSEAAIAANMAKNYINPKEKIQPMHSTTLADIKEKKLAKNLQN